MSCKDLDAAQGGRSLSPLFRSGLEGLGLSLVPLGHPSQPRCFWCLLMAGLDLRGLFQPRRFSKSTNPPLRNPLCAAAGLPLNSAQRVQNPELFNKSQGAGSEFTRPSGPGWALLLSSPLLSCHDGSPATTMGLSLANEAPHPTAAFL